jgi:uncharacterized Zn finger protein
MKVRTSCPNCGTVSESFTSASINTITGKRGCVLRRCPNCGAASEIEDVQIQRTWRMVPYIQTFSKSAR